MKKLVRRFPVVVVAFFVAVMALIACARPAYAKTNKKDPDPEPEVVFVTTDEVNSKHFKFKENTIYIEVCTGVVENKSGDGHVKGHKDWYISYRYKNRPKKGREVVSIFPLDKNGDHEAIARCDFTVKKGKMKKIHTS